MKRRFAYLTLALCATVLNPAVCADSPTAGGSNFKLLFGMTNGQDPQNPSNDVITVTATPSVIGAVVRQLADHPQVRDLTNELSLKFYFDHRTCTGGTRYQVQVSLIGNNNDNNAANAFGYLGNSAFGGGCPSNTWVFNDLANPNDPVARWDLSQFNSASPAPGVTCGGNSMTCTWSQVVSYFSQFPDHKVLQIVLADDSCSFATGACGAAYYDVVGMGDRTLDAKSDTSR